MKFASSICGAMGGAALLLCVPLAAAGQTKTQAPASQCAPDKAGSASCPPATPQKPKSTAEQFPFPGQTEDGSKAAPDAPAPATGAPKGNAAAEHPFPGDSGAAGGDSSGSSSSSSSSSSSAVDGDDASPAADTPPSNAGDKAKDTGRRRLPKVARVQTDEDRAAEDLNIAKFYEDGGDLNAAYLRVKDAVKYQPNDSDTHFALAHLAQKMNKRDEAIAEYNAYVKLDPDGLKIKQARRELEKLQH